MGIDSGWLKIYSSTKYRFSFFCPINFCGDGHFYRKWRNESKMKKIFSENDMDVNRFRMVQMYVKIRYLFRKYFS